MAFGSAVSAVLFVLSFPAFAVESNTVPTNQLTASFAVAPGSGGVATLTVELYQVSALNGVVKEELASISKDEVITFSVNGTSVVYDSTDSSKNILPLVDGGEYVMDFKRANGEAYSAKVNLPGTATFTAPAQSAVFKKEETVTAKWLDVPRDMSILFMSSTCPLNGVGTLNEDFTEFEFPGGWASNCSGPVMVDMNTIYAKAGSGFGTIVGVSASGVGFSYGAQTSARMSKFPGDLGRRVLRARKVNQKVVIY